MLQRQSESTLHTTDFLLYCCCSVYLGRSHGCPLMCVCKKDRERGQVVLSFEHTWNMQSKLRLKHDLSCGVQSGLAL